MTCDHEYSVSLSLGGMDIKGKSKECPSTHSPEEGKGMLSGGEWPSRLWEVLRDVPKNNLAFRGLILWKLVFRLSCPEIHWIDVCNVMLFGICT